MDDGAPQRGFTLMELLVVVSIIAALSAMLMPAIGAVRESAGIARCLGNQRQIALCLLAYGTDNDSHLPKVCASDGQWTHPTWDETLFVTGFLAREELGVLRCPGDRVQRAPNSPPPRSYGANGETTNPSGVLEIIDPKRPMGNPLSIVQAPGRCVLLADTGRDAWACLNWPHGVSAWHDWNWVTWGHRRGTGSGFLFVDGHAKEVAASLRAPAGQANSDTYFGVYSVRATDDATIPAGRY